MAKSDAGSRPPSGVPLGPIPVPQPMSHPAVKPSRVVSETIQLTGWGSLDDVQVSEPIPPKTATPLPQESRFLPSAVGFSGLVQDEYLRLPAATRQTISLPEFEFYHSMIWWCRVYQTCDARQRNSSPVLISPDILQYFEDNAFPLAPSLTQHLRCLGDFEHLGNHHTLQPPLVATDPTNFFGLRLISGKEKGIMGARLLYEWSTSPVLSRQIYRLCHLLFPELPPSELPFRDAAFLPSHTNLMDAPGYVCDSSHRDSFLSSMLSVTENPSLLSLETLSPFDLLRLVRDIGYRLNSVYSAHRFAFSPRIVGSPIQLTFSDTVVHTRPTDPMAKFGAFHTDRAMPSLPALGFIPDSLNILSAAIRLDFHSCIPDEYFSQLDKLSGVQQVSTDALSFWSRYHDENLRPLHPSFHSVRKFEYPIVPRSIQLPPLRRSELFPAT
jgi:hypothetical protein